MQKESIALNYWRMLSGPPEEAYAVLQGMIGKQQEGLHLDFTRWEKDQDAEKKLSKTLCAFANTEGGVLIYGVETQEDPKEKVDTAFKLWEFDDAEFKAGWLRDRSRFISDPPIHGIEVKAIAPAVLNGKGFIVAYCSAGSMAPYRAEKAGKRWLMRNRTDVEDVPPMLLRRMFYPQVRYSLELKVTPFNEFEAKTGLSDQVKGDFKALTFAFRPVGLQTIEDATLDVRHRVGSIAAWNKAAHEAFATRTTLNLPIEYEFRMYPQRWGLRCNILLIESNHVWPDLCLIVYIPNSLPFCLQFQNARYLYEEIILPVPQMEDETAPVYDLKFREMLPARQIPELHD